MKHINDPDITKQNVHTEIRHIIKKVNNRTVTRRGQNSYREIIYICNLENLPSRLSLQWLCGNSPIWAHDVRLHIACTNEAKSA